MEWDPSFWALALRPAEGATLWYAAIGGLSAAGSALGLRAIATAPSSASRSRSARLSAASAAAAALAFLSGLLAFLVHVVALRGPNVALVAVPRTWIRYVGQAEASGFLILGILGSLLAAAMAAIADRRVRYAGRSAALLPRRWVAGLVLGWSVSTTVMAMLAPNHGESLRHAIAALDAGEPMGACGQSGHLADVYPGSAAFRSPAYASAAERCAVAVLERTEPSKVTCRGLLGRAQSMIEIAGASPWLDASTRRAEVEARRSQLLGMEGLLLQRCADPELDLWYSGPGPKCATEDR